MADLTSDSLCGITTIRRDRSGGIRSYCLGCSVEGGYLIYKEGGVAWIISPCTTQVVRTWYGRNDAVTTAENTSPCCTDWFVPSAYDMYIMADSRDFWDGGVSGPYWSDTEEGCCASFVGCCALCFRICPNVILNSASQAGRKPCSYQVRAIRKVYY